MREMMEVICNDMGAMERALEGCGTQAAVDALEGKTHEIEQCHADVEAVKRTVTSMTSDAELVKSMSSRLETLQRVMS